MSHRRRAGANAGTAPPAGVVETASDAVEPPDLRLLVPAGTSWVAVLLSPLAAPTTVVGLAVAAAGAGVVVVVLRRRAPRRPACRLVLAATLLCGAGALAAVGLRGLARDAGPLPGLAAAQAQATVEAIVTDDAHRVAPRPGRPVGAATLWVLRARAERVRSGPSAWAVRQPVLVLASGDGWDRLLPSQRVVLAGGLQPPRRHGDDVAAVVRVRGSPDVVGGPSALQRMAGRLRGGLRTAAAGLPPAERGLLPGLVDGDTGGLDPAVAEQFRVTGLTHLVAVSGSNVVAVLAAALLLARVLRLGPRVAPLAAALALVGFVVLARPSASVVRAGTMGLLGLGAVVTGRTREALPALAATVLGLLLLSPELARTPGFALSALASGALLVLVPGWRAALLARGWRPRAAEALAVPLAAQLVCGPVIAVLAGSVSLVAVPANLLAAPAVPLATVAGVVAAVVAPLSPAAAALAAQVAGLPCRWLVAVARVGAGAPAAQVPWPDGVAGGLLLAVVTVLAVFVARRRRGRHLLALLGVVAVPFLLL